MKAQLNTTKQRVTTYVEILDRNVNNRQELLFLEVLYYAQAKTTTGLFTFGSILGTGSN